MITLEEFHQKYGRLPTEVDPDWKKELTMSLATSKIKVLDSPKLAPGRCCVCLSRGGDHRKFVDVGLDIEYPFAGPAKLHGTVYWCTLCINQLIRELSERGLIELPVKEVEKPIITEKQVEVPVVKHVDLAKELSHLAVAINRLEESVNELVVRNSNNSSTVDSDSSTVSSVKGGKTASNPGTKSK